MKHFQLIVAAGSLGLSASSAFAATTTITFGDADCFGAGGSCASGTTIAAPIAGFDATGILPFPTLDNSTASDPAGTDIFGEIGAVDFSTMISLAGETVVSATFEALVWGLDFFATSPANGGTFGDANEGSICAANGTTIGTYFSLNSGDGAGPNRVELVSFNVAPGLIVDGANTFSITPETDFLPFANDFFTGLDAYAIDYASLTVVTETTTLPPAVPLPAGLPLMVTGLAGLGLLRRARR